MNDYNQTPGDPVIREGGWFEERALREATGYHRQIGKGDGPAADCSNETSKRIIEHSDSTNDWSTAQTSGHNINVHLPTKNGTMPTIDRLARRTDDRKDKFMKMAEQMHADNEMAQKGAEANAIHNATYGDMNPLNRARAIKTLRDPKDRAPLEGQAISLWDDPNINQTGKTPDHDGEKTLRFGTERTFSKTIDETYNKQMR